MTDAKTYNRKLTEDIHKLETEREVLKEILTVEGCTIYKVRRPQEKETVVGYQPSDCFAEKTLTQKAEVCLCDILQKGKKVTIDFSKRLKLNAAPKEDTKC